jgi:transposase
MIRSRFAEDLMKRFVEGADRGQSTLFPECLEDWIGEDNAVRVIDVFVEELDLAGLGFGGVDPEATGRPSYHPSALLKLYIYGYLNRVSSSRRIEREAGHNIEVMWLTGRLVPDHKTIADFRKDNGAAIRKVCARFIALCRTIGLLTQASVAIDGSKFKAVNNRDRNFTRAKMDRRMAQIEESVARYLQQLDTADRQEPSETLQTKTARLKEKIEKLKEQMRRLEVLKVEMLATPDQQISLTDPDARSMATSGRGSGVVGYNVQVAVETEHHLIVTHEVTNDGTDRSQLSPVAKEAKATLDVEKLEVVADRGYFNGEEILACEEAGITVTLPKPMTSNSKAEGRFGKQDFRYVAEEDVYVVLPANGSPTPTRPRKKAWSCTATRPTPAGTAPSSTTAPKATSDVSSDGSMSTFSKPCSAGSTSIRRRCASGARRSSIPSARSRPGWEQPTS